MFGRRVEQVNFGYVQEEGSLQGFKSSAPITLKNLPDERVVMVGQISYKKSNWFFGWRAEAVADMKPGTQWNRHVLVARAFDQFMPGGRK